MEGEASKEGLRSILRQAMCAAKSVRAQRDRLVQLRRRLQRLNPGDDDDAAEVKEVAAGLFKVFFKGLDYASRYLASCLDIAGESGASLDLEPAFTVLPDEQVYGVLLAQRLPARPTTQAEAFSRLEAALYAVKLPEEHHVPRCIELLVGVRPHPSTGERLPFRGMAGYSDDPVAAAHKHLVKYGFPNPARAAATEPTSAAGPAKPPHVASPMDLDQALSYLHRACSLTSLAIKHIDVAVKVFSSFLDSKVVADVNEFADQHTCIPKDGLGPYSWDWDETAAGSMGHC
ncbi:unnamed protein product [Alopecurus aequalis]